MSLPDMKPGLPEMEPVFKQIEVADGYRCPLCDGCCTGSRTGWAEGASVLDPPLWREFVPCGCVATATVAEV